MKTWQLISIVLSALTTGMFHGPWIALSRSMKTFSPEVFLEIVDRMNRNMEPVMTVLMPGTLLSIIPLLLILGRRGLNVGPCHGTDQNVCGTSEERRFPTPGSGGTGTVIVLSLAPGEQAAPRL
jgi:hypothetical protein